MFVPATLPLSYTLEDRSASDFEIGNIVLRSAVDEKEEAAPVGASALWEKILEDCTKEMDPDSEV